jgi:hypothetical protein
MASQSPPRRPARASQPSRKAQATSSVTKPATKKSKKRATAQGSKAAPKRRKVVVPAAAEDNEVVGDEESEPSGAQQQSSPPQGFEYTALWRVDGPKKERLADTVRQFSDILTVTPMSEFKAWYQDQLVAELRDYQFKKVVLASGHGGRVESRWLCAGASTIDFSTLVISIATMRRGMTTCRYRSRRMSSLPLLLPNQRSSRRHAAMVVAIQPPTGCSRRRLVIDLRWRVMVTLLLRSPSNGPANRHTVRTMASIADGR